MQCVIMDQNFIRKSDTSFPLPQQFKKMKNIYVQFGFVFGWSCLFVIHLPTGNYNRN